MYVWRGKEKKREEKKREEKKKEEKNKEEKKKEKKKGGLEKGRSYLPAGALAGLGGALFLGLWLAGGESLWSLESMGNLEASSGISSHPASKAPEDILVVVDPGHGGADEGCSAQEVEEKELNLSISLLLCQKLREKGYQVLLTRETDRYVSLEERVTLANESRADIFVSIHQNSYEGEKAQGVETWYAGVFETPGDMRPMDLEAALAADRTAGSRRLARLIHGQVLNRTHAADREVHGASDYYVTLHTAMPSCLIETGFLSQEEERGALTEEAYQDKVAEGIAEGIDLYFFPKTMYLTFDDGPTRENTVAVLDILKAWGIRATFFVVGENVKKNPEVAKRIVEEGHTIGIHCNSHRYDEIYESVEAFEEDFLAAFDAIYEATGVEPVLFRFPGGSINAYNKEIYADLIQTMTEKGFLYFDWNASLEDAVKHPEPEELLKNARETSLGRRKVVLLAHDTVYGTVLCLPGLLDQFPEYRMEPLEAEVSPIRFKLEE